MTSAVFYVWMWSSHVVIMLNIIWYINQAILYGFMTRIAGRYGRKASNSGECPTPHLTVIGRCTPLACITRGWKGNEHEQHDHCEVTQGFAQIRRVDYRRWSVYRVLA